MEKNFLIKFGKISAALLLASALLVIFIDPLFHYHKPWFGLKAVLTDKEYQCIGTLKNFDYDSLIVGSSVAENYYNAWFNEGFDCTAVKAVRSYGATADLNYFIDTAFENHDLKYIFYNLDTASLVADPVPSFELTGCPMYLYNENPFDDVEYLWNKGVIMEKIPYMAANSLIGDYDENDSYNWAQWKEFNKEMALGLYIRTEEISPMKEKDYYQDVLDANIALIEKQVADHPNTEFKIFFPPYSMLWWDNLYRNGDLDAYLYNMEQAVSVLLDYENVEIYYFQDETEIVTNLDLYMDTLHFAPEINHYIANKIIAGEGQMTKENYAERFHEMKKLTDRMLKEWMVPYEDAIRIG